jgi:hypothetical protein
MELGDLADVFSKDETVRTVNQIEVRVYSSGTLGSLSCD